MGEQFTLAEICYAPFIARINGLKVLDVWLEGRPFAQAWWNRVAQRPSFLVADVGPSKDERAIYESEGGKIANGIAERLSAIRAGRGLEMALTALRGGSGSGSPGIA